MPVDLVIRNGRVMLGGGELVEGVDVVVQGGLIESLRTSATAPSAHRSIDASRQMVLPGFIDAHVHTRAPGYEYKETVEACSTAAAAGGITTMLAMFNVDPLVTDEATYQHFVQYCASRSVVNYNVNAMLTRNVDDLRALAGAGVPSFKMLIGYRHDVSGSGGRPDVGTANLPDDADLLEAMRVLAELGVPLVAHAENDDIIRHGQAALRSRGDVGPSAHVRARPRVAEDEAVSRLICFSRATACRVHILHLTSGVSARMIHAAQVEGVHISAETCPHYLLLTNEDDVMRLGAVAKANPPIRSAWDREQLWAGIECGAITTIGTDHAPHTAQEKMVSAPHEDIFAAMAGFSGIETGVPLMLNEVADGRLTLAQLVRLYAEAPARYFGLYPDRGVLRPGAAADVTIVDLEQRTVLDASRFHSNCKVSPFDGRTCDGTVTHTIVNGKVVYSNGQVLGSPGWGRHVPSRHPVGVP